MQLADSNTDEARKELAKRRKLFKKGETVLFGEEVGAIDLTPSLDCRLRIFPSSIFLKRTSKD